ncbi:inverse autotransporter beta domain-containing protein [Verrucomicrobium spinosum]|uniref:inverse autotransporter beta domain-containing protein n=1 Tax=Verrucomicrobium spinosum TaxID=2736 RepID=UPI0012F65C7B|nr:inverse autotransporter beta domain-containing protein [Verrucomicrobium spinosum]
MNTSSPRTHHVGSRRAPWAQLLGSLVTATPLLALGFALGPAALAGPLDKNPVKNPNLVPVQENHPMYLGTVTSGVKTSDVYTEGNFSIVAPVFSTLGADATLSGDVIYLEPYTSSGEGGEIAASLGLGWRHLFGSQPVSALTRKDAPQASFLEEGFFVGANLFIDMLDTEANNQFWQLGVGIEAGTRYLEVRGNYYIPLSDKQLAEQTRTREILRNSSSRDTTTVSALSDPYATGNTVSQDVSYRTQRTTTTTTTTIERLFSRYEEGMEGWDTEVAVLVPGLDKYFDLRLIGGYYSFDNQPFGPQTGGTGNVEGWKAGVEVRPVPAVILTGTWYEDDRLTGSDWTAGVQLQLPFELGDLGDGKGFWGRIGDSFKPRRRHLAERLAEPVHRQNAAIKVANTVDVDTKTSTSVQKVTKVVSQTPGKIVLADDIVFVNNGGPVGNGIQAGDTFANGADGTAENPVDTLTEGAGLAAQNSLGTSRLWTVYTQGGTGIDYNDNAITAGMTRFTSSYLPIVGLDGRTFGGNTARPVLYGGIISYFGPTLIVEGYDFRNGILDFGIAIFGITTSNALIRHNLFSDIGESNFEEGAGAVTFYVQDEQPHQLVVENNEFRDVFNSIGLIAEGNLLTDTLNVTLDVRNNLFGGEGYALFATSAYGSGLVTTNFTNNEVTGDFSIPFIFWTEGNVTLNSTFANNIFTSSSEVEYMFGADVSDDSKFNLIVKNNQFLGDVWENQFDLYSYDQSTLTADIQNNLFSNEIDQLMYVEQHDDSTLAIHFAHNIVEAEFGRDVISLNVYGNSAGKLIAKFENNLFSGDFADDVIDAHLGDSASDGILDLTIAGNQFTDYIGDSAIDIFAWGDSTVNVKVYNNTVAEDAYIDSTFLEISAEETATIAVTQLDNNLIFGHVEYGFDFFKDAAATFSAFGTQNNLVTAPASSDILLNLGITGSFFVNGFEFPF